MNVIRLREAADSLLDKGKYDNAYYVYDEIHNQIWNAIGSVQTGLNEFSQSFLGNNFKSNNEFRNSYTIKATESTFKKWFNLDADQTLNELTFTTYGLLQCVCYSTNLNSMLPAATIYNEFLVLHSMILETDNWVNSLFKIVTPVVEGRKLKRLRTNISESNIKKNIVANAIRLKSTDWFNVNITFLDYLLNTGDNSSEIYTSLRKVVGFHSKHKGHYREKAREESKARESGTYESYEKYEKYERFEKHSFGLEEEEFDPLKATEFEKAKYYGELLGLKGKITKAEIREKYLIMISKYHPDKVFSLGDELKILAEKKTKQLNLAYDWMKKKYFL